MPVNLRTYYDGKNIYSVDMMLAYINTKGHTIKKLPIDVLTPQLEQHVWGDWSPKMVLDKMDLKKYSENAERIKKSDLKYPIIVTGNATSYSREHTIVDGYHRLSKAVMEAKKDIKVYIFDTALMNKFIINKDHDFVKVHQNTEMNELLELWTKRFC
jgi:hypothetical protein